MAELLSYKDQIEDIDNPIAIGVWSGCTQTVGNLNQVQDIDMPIAVDIGEAFGREIDFAVKVGKNVGVRCSIAFPIGDRSSR